jgi:hypothetical protein
MTGDVPSPLAWQHGSRFDPWNGNIVHSHRMLGAVALGAVVVSAISFAVVDVSIANANGCIGASTTCVDQVIPIVAITFAVLGALSLAISVVPAVQWFITAVHPGHHDDHDVPEELAVEAARIAMVQRLTPVEDDV